MKKSPKYPGSTIANAERVRDAKYGVEVLTYDTLRKRYRRWGMDMAWVFWIAFGCGVMTGWIGHATWGWIGGSYL